jgi:hypothetical protein
MESYAQLWQSSHCSMARGEAEGAEHTAAPQLSLKGGQ